MYSLLCYVELTSAFPGLDSTTKDLYVSHAALSFFYNVF